MSIVAELPLVGAGGEPVDFARTIVSHGVAELPPNRVDLEARTLETTLPVPRGARTVRISEQGGRVRVEVSAGSSSETIARALAATVRHMLRLDEDLSSFYSVCRDDAELGWCAHGAGRMLRAPTVFEDVVKTICTTNTAWSGTRKMTAALVDNLGAAAPGGSRAFPTAATMAEASETFYRDVIRAGYRGPYLKQLARDVADGRVDLETLNDPAFSDDEVALRLLALPGVGPYAAAHLMLTSLGRYSRLVLDSWTRPTYGKLSGARRSLKDSTIERRFRRYGEWAGLAFWLYLTLGRRRPTRLVTLRVERPGPVAQLVFKTSEPWQPHGGQVRLLCRSASVLGAVARSPHLRRTLPLTRNGVGHRVVAV